MKSRKKMDKRSIAAYVFLFPGLAFLVLLYCFRFLWEPTLLSQIGMELVVIIIMCGLTISFTF